jgi:hypothetical protein
MTGLVWVAAGLVGVTEGLVDVTVGLVGVSDMSCGVGVDEVLTSEVGAGSDGVPSQALSKKAPMSSVINNNFFIQVSFSLIILFKG